MDDMMSGLEAIHSKSKKQLAKNARKQSTRLKKIATMTTAMETG